VGHHLVFQKSTQARRIGLIRLMTLGFAIVVARVVEVFRVDVG
jgi:hypothetical protein